MGANFGVTNAEFPFIRLSLPARYAISGMLYLAQNAGKYCLVEEAARAQGLPRNFLGKIFQRLTHQGLLVSQRGPGGGYTLAHPAEQISLMQVLQAAEEVPSRKKQCFLEPHPCGRGWKECVLHGAVINADRSLKEALARVNMKDLA